MKLVVTTTRLPNMNRTLDKMLPVKIDTMI
jgi:hypothetical protein